MVTACACWTICPPASARTCRRRRPHRGRRGRSGRVARRVARRRPVAFISPPLPRWSAASPTGWGRIAPTSPARSPSSTRSAADPASGGLRLLGRGVRRCRDHPDHRGDPVPPLSAYGADKYGCELHARVAGQVHGIPTVGLRFFNVYGPRQDPHSPYSGVISIFCERIAAARRSTSWRRRTDARLRLRRRRCRGAAGGDAARAGRGAGVQRLHRHRDLGAGPGADHRRSRRHAARPSPWTASRGRNPPLDRSAGPLAQVLRLPEPVPLRIGLGQVLDWLDGPG